MIRGMHLTAYSRTAFTEGSVLVSAGSPVTKYSANLEEDNTMRRRSQKSTPNLTLQQRRFSYKIHISNL